MGIEGLTNAIGTVAEMTLLFYRSALNSGATEQEALLLTQAYLVASIHGKNNLPKKE